jgi:hypothetical protein
VGTFAEVALVRKPTHVSGKPTFWRGFLLALGARAGEVPLACATLGGEAVDQGTLDRIAHAFPGVAIGHIYAATEAGALFAVRDGKAGFPADWLESGVDGVTLRIVDGMFEVSSPRARVRGRPVARSLSTRWPPAISRPRCPWCSGKDSTRRSSTAPRSPVSVPWRTSSP